VHLDSARQWSGLRRRGPRRDRRRSRLTLNRFDIDDYGNVGNALSGGHEIASASLSISIRWSAFQQDVAFTNRGLPTAFSAHELQSMNSRATIVIHRGHWLSRTSDEAVSRLFRSAAERASVATEGRRRWRQRVGQSRSVGASCWLSSNATAVLSCTS